MPRYQKNICYATTLTQFKIDGGDPLKFIWKHELRSGILKESNKTFTSDGFVTNLGNAYYDESSEETLKIGYWKDPNGNVQWQQDHMVHVFSFPISITEDTIIEPTSKGKKGLKLTSLRYLSVDPSMEERIKELNHNATTRIAKSLYNQGIGNDDKDRWYRAERIISNY